MHTHSLQLTTKYLFISLVFLFLSRHAFALTEGSPTDLIKGSADEVMEDIQRNKKFYTDEPVRLERYISEKVTDTFDFRKMTQMVMGQFWRKASNEQKAEIALLFRDMLVRTYSSALLNYSETKIQYAPERVNKRKAVVPTTVAQSGGASIPINYKLFQNKAKQWRVYDVAIDGISLLTSYRGVFKNHIKRGGIDGLIKVLKNSQKS